LRIFHHYCPPRSRPSPSKKEMSPLSWRSPIARWLLLESKLKKPSAVVHRPGQRPTPPTPGSEPTDDDCRRRGEVEPDLVGRHSQTQQPSLHPSRKKASKIAKRQLTRLGLLYKSSRTHRRHRSRAPTGRGQVGALFHHHAAAIASSTSTGKTNREGTPFRLNLAPPPATDGERTLHLGKHLPTICIPARRFAGYCPSPRPSRAPERKRTDEIAAGTQRHLLFALGNCSGRIRHKEREALSWSDLVT
jgi:hypothetical protein